MGTDTFWPITSHFGGPLFLLATLQRQMCVHILLASESLMQCQTTPALSIGVNMTKQPKKGRLTYQDDYLKRDSDNKQIKLEPGEGRSYGAPCYS